MINKSRRVGGWTEIEIADVVLKESLVNFQTLASLKSPKFLESQTDAADSREINN